MTKIQAAGPVAEVVAKPALSADRDGGILLVICGLPGSGKTTLLRRLLAGAPPAVAGLDTEQVTARLRAAGVRVPYGLLFPWVHLAHRWRVLKTIGDGPPLVVVTDPWTSGPWRAIVMAFARRAGRSVRLVLIETSRETAEQGQRARGRAVPAFLMRRHAARLTWLRQNPAPSGTGSAVVMDRVTADGLVLADILDRTSAEDGLRLDGGEYRWHQEAA